MFGDKMMVGQYEVTVDKKHRIVLPAKTNSEENDQVVLMYDDTLDIYNLYNKRILTEKFEALDKMIMNAANEEEYIARSLVFYKFCKSIIKEYNLEKQKRICLGSEFIPNEKILLIGANDHLILERKK